MSNSVYKLSWMAYVRSIITLPVFLFISILFIEAKTVELSIIGYILFILSVIKFICDVLFIRTLHMWFDDDGVWIRRGIFPWTRGRIGTNWRDISGATYFTSFVSWVTKSNKVSVEHRFTQSSELIVKHLKHGDRIVEEINSIISSKYKDQ